MSRIRTRGAALLSAMTGVTLVVAVGVAFGIVPRQDDREPAVVTSAAMAGAETNVVPSAAPEVPAEATTTVAPSTTVPAPRATAVPTTAKPATRPKPPTTPSPTTVPTPAAAPVAPAKL